MRSTSHQAARGTVTSSAARSRSEAIRIGRLRMRSTWAEAKRPSAKPGSSEAAASTAMSLGVASSSRIATKGSAMCRIMVPKFVMVAALHRRTKSRLRQRPGAEVGLIAGLARRQVAGPVSSSVSTCTMTAVIPESLPLA